MVTKVKSDYLITLDEAKAHLRIDTSDEDSTIEDCIKAAVNHCENYIQKDIATTEVTILLEDFSGSLIDVDEGNLVSIDSVKDESDTDLPYSKEPVRYYDSHFRIELDDWLNEQDVEIRIKTGYTVETLPPAIKQSIKIKIADLFDVERNSYNLNNQTVNNAINNLLDFYVAKRVKHIKN
jgi:hypothetical protein